MRQIVHEQHNRLDLTRRNALITEGKLAVLMKRMRSNGELTCFENKEGHVKAQDQRRPLKSLQASEKESPDEFCAPVVIQLYQGRVWDLLAPIVN